MEEHLPDVGIAPEIWLHLRVDFNPKVVVAAIQHGRCGVTEVVGEADHILSELFEGVVERAFVVFALSLTVTD